MKDLDLSLQPLSSLTEGSMEQKDFDVLAQQPRQSSKASTKSWPSTPSEEFFNALPEEEANKSSANTENKAHSIGRDPSIRRTVQFELDNLLPSSLSDEESLFEQGHLHIERAKGTVVGDMLSPTQQALNDVKFSAVEHTGFYGSHREVTFPMTAFLIDMCMFLFVCIVGYFFTKFTTAVTLSGLSVADFIFFGFVGFQCYGLVTRLVFKKTFGEWIRNISLGTNRQQRGLVYPFCLVWRSFVLLMTGVVTLPLLSFYGRQDIMSYATEFQFFQSKAAS